MLAALLKVLDLFVEAGWGRGKATHSSAGRDIPLVSGKLALVARIIDVFGHSRQEPAEVGKPVQVSQNLAVRICVRQHQGRDATFRVPARRTSQVESSRVHRFAGD